MEHVLHLPPSPPAALLDGALALALATGAVLELSGGLTAADRALLVAGARLSGDVAAAESLRARLEEKTDLDVALPRPRAGDFTLELREPGAVARAATALAWPLALLGRGSTLTLLGPNHCAGGPTFHALRLGWAPLAAAFGLRVGLELHAAAFAWDEGGGELLLTLDPSPALAPLQLQHRGILRHTALLGASGSGAQREAQRGAREAARQLRLRGVDAEIERLPLPLSPAQQATPARRWALTSVAEFEHAVVALSALPEAPPRPPAVPELQQRAATSADEDSASDEVGARAAEALGRFLSSHGALDGAGAERALVPAILCAAGLGARAGPAPQCHFTTTEVTPALLALAALAHTVLPVRAAIDGAPGEEGVVVVAAR